MIDFWWGLGLTLIVWAIVLLRWRWLSAEARADERETRKWEALAAMAEMRAKIMRATDEWEFGA